MAYSVHCRPVFLQERLILVPVQICRFTSEAQGAAIHRDMQHTAFPVKLSGTPQLGQFSEQFLLIDSHWRFSFQIIKKEEGFFFPSAVCAYILFLKHRLDFPPNQSFTTST